MKAYFFLASHGEGCGHRHRTLFTAAHCRRGRRAHLRGVYRFTGRWPAKRIARITLSGRAAVIMRLTGH